MSSPQHTQPFVRPRSGYNRLLIGSPPPSWLHARPSCSSNGLPPSLRHAPPHSAECGDKGFEPISYKHISIRLCTTTIPNGHVCVLANYTYNRKTTHPPILVDGRGEATRAEDPEKPQATRRRGSRPNDWLTRRNQRLVDKRRLHNIHIFMTPPSYELTGNCPIK